MLSVERRQQEAVARQTSVDQVNLRPETDPDKKGATRYVPVIPNLASLLENRWATLGVRGITTKTSVAAAGDIERAVHDAHPHLIDHISGARHLWQPTIGVHRLLRLLQLELAHAQPGTATGPLFMSAGDRLGSVRAMFDAILSGMSGVRLDLGTPLNVGAAAFKTIHKTLFQHLHKLPDTYDLYGMASINAAADVNCPHLPEVTHTTHSWILAVVCLDWMVEIKDPAAVAKYLSEVVLPELPATSRVASIAISVPTVAADQRGLSNAGRNASIQTARTKVFDAVKGVDAPAGWAKLEPAEDVNGFIVLRFGRGPQARGYTRQSGRFDHDKWQDYFRDLKITRWLPTTPRLAQLMRSEPRQWRADQCTLSWNNAFVVVRNALLILRQVDPTDANPHIFVEEDAGASAVLRATELFRTVFMGANARRDMATLREPLLGSMRDAIIRSGIGGVALGGTRQHDGFEISVLPTTHRVVARERGVYYRAEYGDDYRTLCIASGQESQFESLKAVPPKGGVAAAIAPLTSRPLFDKDVDRNVARIRNYVDMFTSREQQGVVVAVAHAVDAEWTVRDDEDYPMKCVIASSAEQLRRRLEGWKGVVYQPFGRLVIFYVLVGIDKFPGLGPNLEIRDVKTPISGDHVLKSVAHAREISKTRALKLAEYKGLPVAPADQPLLNPVVPPRPAPREFKRQQRPIDSLATAWAWEHIDENTPPTSRAELDSPLTAIADLEALRARVEDPSLSAEERYTTLLHLSKRLHEFGRRYYPNKPDDDSRLYAGYTDAQKAQFKEWRDTREDGWQPRLEALARFTREQLGEIRFDNRNPVVARMLREWTLTWGNIDRAPEPGIDNVMAVTRQALEQGSGREQLVLLRRTLQDRLVRLEHSDRMAAIHRRDEILALTRRIDGRLELVTKAPAAPPRAPGVDDTKTFEPPREEKKHAPSQPEDRVKWAEPYLGPMPKNLSTEDRVEFASTASELWDDFLHADDPAEFERHLVFARDRVRALRPQQQQRPPRRMRRQREQAIGQALRELSSSDAKR